MTQKDVVATKSTAGDDSGWSTGLAILLPAGLWLLAFMLVPVIIIGVFSLGSRDSLGQINLAFQPDNYVRFFNGPYLLCLWRSLWLAFLTTAGCLLLGFPVAAWLAFQVPPKKQGVCDVVDSPSLDFISAAYLCMDNNFATYRPLALGIA